MVTQKIFGIGLSKTGTNTLCRALEILGYSAKHAPHSFEEVARHDVAANNFVADHFEELDRRHPGSRFIYTVRERDAWLGSFRHHWWRKGKSAQLRANPKGKVSMRRLYQTERFDAALLDDSYDRHDRRVLSYFQDRPDDLLTIDLCAPGEKWPALCGFVGRPLPETPFPHKNAAPMLLISLRDLINLLRKHSKPPRRALRNQFRKMLVRLSH